MNGRDMFSVPTTSPKRTGHEQYHPRPCAGFSGDPLDNVVLAASCTINGEPGVVIVMTDEVGETKRLPSCLQYAVNEDRTSGRARI
jgi:hypothetical protein